MYGEVFRGLGVTGGKQLAVICTREDCNLVAHSLVQGIICSLNHESWGVSLLQLSGA